MFKVYHTNMLNFETYIGEFYFSGFEFVFIGVRYALRVGRISGFRIVRSSDGVTLAESKRQP